MRGERDTDSLQILLYQTIKQKQLWLIFNGAHF